MKRLMTFRIIALCSVISFCIQLFSYPTPKHSFTSCAQIHSLSIKSRLKQYTIFFSISQVLEEIIESGETKGIVELFWIEYEDGDDFISFRLNHEGDMITIEISDANLDVNQKYKKINLLEQFKRVYPENDDLSNQFKKVLFNICENPHIIFKLKKTGKKPKIAKPQRRFQFPENKFNKNDLRWVFTPFKFTAGVAVLTLFSGTTAGLLFYDKYLKGRFPDEKQSIIKNYLESIQDVQKNNSRANAKRILKLLRGIITSKTIKRETQNKIPLLEKSA